MRIAGKYSFNKGQEAMEETYAEELSEIYRVIETIDAQTHKNKVSKEQSTQGQLFYNPTELNKEFTRLLTALGWHSQVSLPCEYSREYYVAGYAPPSEIGKQASRDIDYVKNRVGLEVQFGKYAYMVYNVCAKMTIFHAHDIIDVGVEIVAVREMTKEMSSGVSYFEQFTWDLDQRGVADIDIPVLVIGVAPDPSPSDSATPPVAAPRQMSLFPADES